MPLPGTTIEYNGISLGVIGTEQWVRQHKVDEAGNYLYTIHTITANTVYTPNTAGTFPASSLSVDLNTLPGDGNLPAGGANPIFSTPTALGSVTDVALRHALSKPRKNLRVYNNSGLVLASPRPNSFYDAFNGPFPMVHSITRINGVKSYFVQLTIQTAVNESYLFTDNPPVTVSYMQEVSMDLDQDFYTTRTIRAVAKLNVEELRRRNLRADQLRESLAPRVLPGYKRESVKIGVAPDESAISWEVVDREVAITVIPHFFISRIEGLHTEEVGFLGIENLGWAAVDDAAEVLRAATEGGIAPLAAGAYALALTAKTARNFLPVRRATVVVRIWGTKFANRKNLTSAAVDIVLLRFGGNGGLGVAADDWGRIRAISQGFELKVTQDIMGKFVEVQGRIIGSPILGFAGSIIDAIQGDSFGFSVVDGMPFWSNAANEQAGAMQEGPTPPGGSVTGTSTMPAIPPTPLVVDTIPPVPLNPTAVLPVGPI